MRHAACKKILLITNDHLQFTSHHVGNLFMRVLMGFQYTAFFYFPDGDGSFIAMNKFSKETGAQLTNGNGIKMFHK